MVEANKEKFLWDSFRKAKTATEYFREVRRVKGKDKDE